MIGSTTWTMGATLRVGVAVTAHTNATLGIAVFESVRITVAGGSNG